MRSRGVRIVSFSGIDGAGKSTQIDELLRSLRNAGYKPQLYTFWDDVVALSGLREHLSIRIFQGDSGVGSPDRPIERRDKNVTSSLMICVRLLLYLLDLCSLRMLLWAKSRTAFHLTIFDRYIYDELANLPLHLWSIRLYVRAVLLVVPKPKCAFVLDAEPNTASHRKPEYPLEFVRRNREAYLRLGEMAGLKIVSPGTIEKTAEIIRDDVFANCLGWYANSTSSLPVPLGISESEC